MMGRCIDVDLIKAIWTTNVANNLACASSSVALCVRTSGSLEFIQVHHNNTPFHGYMHNPVFV